MAMILFFFSPLRYTYCTAHMDVLKKWSNEGKKIHFNNTLTSSVSGVGLKRLLDQAEETRIQVGVVRNSDTCLAAVITNFLSIVQ